MCKVALNFPVFSFSFLSFQLECWLSFNFWIDRLNVTSLSLVQIQYPLVIDAMNRLTYSSFITIFSFASIKLNCQKWLQIDSWMPIHIDEAIIPPSGSMEISGSPSSVVHASACLVESQVFIIGGRNSFSQTEDESLMPMNILMKGTQLGFWINISALKM